MFQTVFTFIDNIVAGAIGGMVVSIMNIITPLVGACVAIYALYIIYKSLFESEDLMIMESLKFIASLALVTTVALSSSWYMSKLVPFVLGAGDDIAGALLSGGSASSLQGMFDKMFDTVEYIWKPFVFDLTSGESWLDMLKNGFLSFVVFAGNVIFIALATGYLIIAKFMLGILLIVGPIFIMMAFFPTSRSFFQSWTGQVFNNTLLTIVFPVAFSFFKATLENTIYLLTPTIFACLLTLIVFIALCLLAMQIPTLCSTLSGGFGISGINSQLLGAGKAAGVGQAAKAAGKGLSKGAGALQNAFKGKIFPG